MMELKTSSLACLITLSFCMTASAQVSIPERDIAEELGMVFVSIPGGSFSMGSPSSEANRSPMEGPVHTVTVPAFELMTTEVTQGMWEEVMGSNPSDNDNGVGLSFPVYNVSWNDCQEFINQLNSLDTDYEYRLPSEAEWEYACRAGTTTAYYWGNSMNGGYCWYTENSDGTTHPVAQKLPNAWGLYDMSGNVEEWCQDYVQGTYSGAPTDGSAWLSPVGSYPLRTRRGGCYCNLARNSRSASRSFSVPGNRDWLCGLRLARSAR